MCPPHDKVFGHVTERSVEMSLQMCFCRVVIVQRCRRDSSDSFVLH